MKVKSKKSFAKAMANIYTVKFRTRIAPFLHGLEPFQFSLGKKMKTPKQEENEVEKGPFSPSHPCLLLIVFYGFDGSDPP